MLSEVCDHYADQSSSIALPAEACAVLHHPACERPYESYPAGVLASNSECDRARERMRQRVLAPCSPLTRVCVRARGRVFEKGGRAKKGGGRARENAERWRPPRCGQGNSSSTCRRRSGWRTHQTTRIPTPPVRGYQCMPYAYALCMLYDVYALANTCSCAASISVQQTRVWRRAHMCAHACTHAR